VFFKNGKFFSGALMEVSRVYNQTKAEALTSKITAFRRTTVDMSDLGTYVSGDVIVADYKYIKPFEFVLFGVSPKIRYNSPWVLDEATAVLVVPYWAKVGANDLFTALSAQQSGQEIIDPNMSVDDNIKGYYDVSRILSITMHDGSERSVNDVLIYDGNKLKWLTAKPTRRYTIQFTYNPTYTALVEGHSLKSSENKEFVNRVNLMRFDKTNDVVRF
jgi:hypothetical protein